MRRCSFCGTNNPDENQYCSQCKEDLTLFDTDSKTEPVQEIIYEKKEHYHQDEDVVRCPYCGSKNVHFITKESGSELSASNACCGYMLLGPIGLLCGLTGNKEVKAVRKCMNCEGEF